MGPPGSLEILNLETIIFRGEQLVLGSVSIQLMIFNNKRQKRQTFFGLFRVNNDQKILHQKKNIFS